MLCTYYSFTACQFDSAVPNAKGQQVLNFCPNGMQVLDEIGVDIHSKMATAPKNKLVRPQQEADTAQEDKEADDLIARLSALK